MKDNLEKQRYELEVDGNIVFANYRRENGVLHLLYVEASPALRGTGTANQLLLDIMALARSRGEKVNPICGYAAAWLRKNQKDFGDLVVGG
jgi:predicted GNAT family acetyltransferase